jgi:hypothetical protein
VIAAAAPEAEGEVGSPLGCRISLAEDGLDGGPDRMIEPRSMTKTSVALWLAACGLLVGAHCGWCGGVKPQAAATVVHFGRHVPDSGLTLLLTVVECLEMN